MNNKNKIKAGSAITNVTPYRPMFLYGYPYVQRVSDGTNDSLYASALIIDNGEVELALCAVDVIFISKELTEKVRSLITEKTGIPKKHIMLSASHTHSGPVTVNDLFDDPVVPGVDEYYMDFLASKIVEVIVQAWKNKTKSTLAITTANAIEIGGNRRSTSGASDPEVALILVKDVRSKKLTAVFSVFCMHPTVIHEDSRKYSADFPGYTRKYLKEKFGDDLVLLYTTGPSGNQSPRHFISKNTFEEAEKLGYMLGKRMDTSIEGADENNFFDKASVSFVSKHINLMSKNFKPTDWAIRNALMSKNKLKKLRLSNAPPAEIRTAECDWFGAEEYKQLAMMAESGLLKQAYNSVLPVEISCIRINEFSFVFLPGEIFVEYSLEIKKHAPRKTFVTSLSNGILYGYIVTYEAEKEGGYEASNSIFPAEAGNVIIYETINLLNKL